MIVLHRSFNGNKMLLFKLLNWDMSNIKNEDCDVFDVNTLMTFKMLSFLSIVSIFSAIFEHFIICPLIIVLIIGMGISVVCFFIFFFMLIILAG